jgi:hypothetical protein
MSNRLPAYCMLLLTVLGPGCPSLSARMLDIGRVDLLGMERWNSTQVSVEGLRLGMSLDQAQAALSERGLGLYDYMDRPNPCRVGNRSCDVSRNGLTGGTIITVGMDGNGRITAIVIGIPEDPATLSQTIAGRFKGMTRRFFFHYSDALRLKLLGPPDRVKKSPTTDAMQGQIYYYDRLGLIVGTSRSLMRGMKAPTPPELSDIEFVMPKPVPQKKPGHE